MRLLFTTSTAFTGPSYHLPLLSFLVLLFICFCASILLCSPGWPQTLDLLVSECWDYRCEPLCLAKEVLFFVFTTAKGKDQH
jgi:dolichol kinase